MSQEAEIVLTPRGHEKLEQRLDHLRSVQRREVAERIRDRVRAFHFLTNDGLSVRLTTSIGVATLPDVAASAEEFL